MPDQNTPQPNASLSRLWETPDSEMEHWTPEQVQAQKEIESSPVYQQTKVRTALREGKGGLWLHLDG